MSTYHQMWAKLKATSPEYRQGFLDGYGPARGKDVEFMGQTFFDVDLLESMRNSISQGA